VSDEMDHLSRTVKWGSWGGITHGTFKDSS